MGAVVVAIILTVLVLIPLMFGTFRRVVIALDQTLNAYFRGYEDETLSSRSFRWDKDGKRSWPRKLIDKVFLLFGDKDHCRESYENERKGRGLPPEMRKG